MKRLFLLFFLLCACSLVIAEEAKPEAQKMRMRAYRARPDIFLEPNATDSSGQMGYVHGVKRIVEPEDQYPRTLQFDVREFLTDQGAQFIAGEEAIFEQASNLVIVHARPETINLIDAIFGGGCGGFSPHQLQVEVSLVEFSAEKTSSLKGGVSFDVLRKAAGDSWRVLSRMMVSTKSGQRALAVSKNVAPGEKPPTPPLARDGSPVPAGFEGLLPGEFGTKLEVEPVVGPDGRTVDLNVGYHYRPRGRDVVEWETTNSIFVVDGLPSVVQLNTYPP